MKNLIAASLFLFISMSSKAVDPGGVTMPDQLPASDISLALNGAGIRSKFFIDLYVAGLYLQNQSSDASAIILADELMVIRLHIISARITSKKMVNATREGFGKSTASLNIDSSKIAAEINQFLEAFSEEIKEGDIFDLHYQPSQGVIVTKNGEEKTLVPSLEFKQALFGIWLSDQPVQNKLKKDMLGS